MKIRSLSSKRKYKRQLENLGKTNKTIQENDNRNMKHSWLYGGLGI